MDPLHTYNFDELCALVDLPSRTVRYYIQTGVVDRADGINRGAKYSTRHVEQLLSVKKWQAAGLSLERIRELLHNEGQVPPPPRQKPGMVEVWSRLHVAQGIELHVEAGASGLSPEALRAFFKRVMSAYDEIKNDTKGSEHD